MNREDVAWAAGLFEGEGCIKGRKYNGSMYLRLHLNSTDRDTVYRFAQIVGVGGIRYDEYENPNWSPQWCWYASSFEDVQAVIALLWRWFGDRRRARATQLLTEAQADWVSKTNDQRMRSLRTSRGQKRRKYPSRIKEGVNV